MQRNLISTSTQCFRLRATANGVQLDHTSKTMTRSFGKKLGRATTKELLDPEARAARVKLAGDYAIQNRLDRNAYNKKYQERKKGRKEDAKARDEEKKVSQQALALRKAKQQRAYDAKKATMEDWTMGPLAPKRDVAELEGLLGTIELTENQTAPLTKREKKDVEKRMRGNVFKVHDRVVVTEGRDTGKIGQILSIDKESMTANIEGVNLYAVRIPDHLKNPEDVRPARVVRRPVQLDKLKLVSAIRQPDGTMKEVVVDNMETREVLTVAEGSVATVPATTTSLKTYEGEIIEPTDEEKGQPFELQDYKWKSYRYIPNSDIEILDLSKEVDEDEVDENAPYNAVDTLLISVDEQTYWPDLLVAPHPHSVSWEVANKNKKTNTRFSEALKDKLRLAAEVEERRKLAREDAVRTPLQELRVKLNKVQAAELQMRKQAFTDSAIVDLGKAIAEAQRRSEEKQKNLASIMPLQPSAAVAEARL